MEKYKIMELTVPKLQDDKFMELQAIFQMSKSNSAHADIIDRFFYDVMSGVPTASIWRLMKTSMMAIQNVFFFIRYHLGRNED